MFYCIILDGSVCVVQMYVSQIVSVRVCITHGVYAFTDFPVVSEFV